MKTVLVTGGSGFIGSALVRWLLAHTDVHVVNIDKLTYAGNPESLADIEGDHRYTFIHADICDQKTMQQAFTTHKPTTVMHLAAESHVDRSIDSAAEFIQTNIVGTSVLLDTALDYWRDLDGAERDAFRFLHVSTDEVYGSLGSEGLFTEETPYDPSSPYSASKASSDHLVRAWHRTYGLPVLITNCSNNYGPRQFPEKLIPLMILSCLDDKPLPVYGTGENIRDWLYVEDHVEALWLVVSEGMPGRTYNIGGHNELRNIEVVHMICDLMDELSPSSTHASYRELITYVSDRPGHDLRYAIDASRIASELGWKPRETFETGFRKTVQWYLDNRDWWRHIQQGTYQGQRLGLKGVNNG